MPVLILEPTAIAYVDEANQATNYGQNSGFLNDMYVRSETGANRRLYVKYDPSALAATVTIMKAYIIARVDAVSGAPGTATFDGPRITTAAWAYNTITWNLQPARDTTTTVDTYAPPQGPFVHLDVRDIVQDWVDGTTANNGCWFGATTEDDGVGYGWTLTGANTVQRWSLIIEYRNVDTLPASAVDLRRQFVGDAVTELENLSTEAEWTLTAELDAGDLDLTAHMLDGTRITRKLPFLTENKMDIGSASFKLDNPDGRYSPNRKSSQFYSRRVVGRTITLSLTVAGQKNTIFSGKMRQPVAYPDQGIIEIEAQQQDIVADTARVLSQDNLALEIYAGNPADSIYEFLHNQAGVADTDTNLSTFVDAKTTWTAQGMQVGQATIERPASDILQMLQEASLGQLYLDWRGKYALHVWQPTDPTPTTLTNFTLEQYGDQFDYIRNYITVYYGRGLTNFLIFPDDGSISGEGGFDGWGVRPMEIKNDMLRTPYRANMAAHLYLQALADPIWMGRVSGGLNLIRHELGEAVRVIWEPEDVDETCLVKGISVYPATNEVTLDLIKAHWTLPRRNFVLGTWVNQVSEDTYPGTTTSPMSDPVPSTISTVSNNDGTMTAKLAWTYTQGDTPANGYVVWVNHSSTDGQPVPTTADYNATHTIWGPHNKKFSFQLPQDEYFTVAVSAFRTPSANELFVPITPKVYYSNLVSSSSDPDWWSVQHSTGVVVSGKTSGDIYGDLYDSSGNKLFDSEAHVVASDTTGAHYGNITGDLYDSSGNKILDYDARTISPEVTFSSAVTRTKRWTGRILAPVDITTTDYWTYDSVSGYISLPSLGSNTTFNAVGSVSVPVGASISLLSVKAETADLGDDQFTLYSYSSGSTGDVVAQLTIPSTYSSPTLVQSSALSHTVTDAETFQVVWGATHPSSAENPTQLGDISISYTITNLYDQG